ncbi:phenylacetate--CoA ligase family protein [Nocardiopsis lucentensis]|uniref:phenylacetate--CoA ligase family protein n=1 Tax=Nocardiopsis lucentensis TaxID=53441 RepID=UPI0004773285|nr:AMP-binding protein [Nocardiopsis lucentensis]
MTPTSPPRLGDWNSIGELRELQEKALPRAMELAARSPRYRDLPIPASVEELGALPLTGKGDLRAAYPFGLLAVERERLATYHESSGTSGAPTSSYFTDHDWADVADRFTRGAVGIDAADTLMVRTPYAMLTTGHQAHLGGRSRGATVVPADNRSAVVTYARVVRMLRDLDVTVTWSLPTECLLWAAAARTAGLDPGRDFPSLRALLVAGEPLTAARRNAISRAWGGIPVMQDYGSTETGSLAGECGHGRLHLWADRFIPQVMDPDTGRSARTGVGNLVITTLYREAMPLVRYDLEDRVRVSEEECPCRWHLPTVEVLGRDAGTHAVAGVRVTPGQIERAVFSLPGEHGVLFWRARAREDLLEVELEVDPRYEAAARAQVASALREDPRVRSRVLGVPPGTLVPESVLRGEQRFVKPRHLFGPGEDWDEAVLYY